MVVGSGGMGFSSVWSMRSMSKVTALLRFSFWPTSALACVFDWLAGGVVVVAELFLAEAWAGAAASVGEDVAALVLVGRFGCVLHGPSPRGTFLCKVFEREEMSPDFPAQLFPSCC